MIKISKINADITQLHVDAVVNAANPRLAAGGGVCGAIHDAAGPALGKKCSEIGGCGHGEAVITDGYNLPAKYIIHTVGPIYGQHDGSEAEILFSCYYESLRLADTHQVTSIAFPAIATGVYHYPPSEASSVAQSAVEAYSEDVPGSSIESVLFVSYEKETSRV